MKRLNLIALIALPVAIGATYGLDRWQNAIRESANETLDVLSILRTTPAVNLLYAVALLALFWLITRGPDRWVGAVYLVVGLVMLFYPLLRLSTLANLTPSIKNLLPFSPDLFNPVRGVSLAGAFITASGLWGLIRPQSRAVE